MYNDYVCEIKFLGNKMRPFKYGNMKFVTYFIKKLIKRNDINAMRNANVLFYMDDTESESKVEWGEGNRYGY